MTGVFSFFYFVNQSIGAMDPPKAAFEQAIVSSIKPLVGSTDTPTTLPPSKRQKRSGGSQYGMYEDIEEMMFGFGDKWPPNSDSVELMEKIAANYIRNICHRAKDVAELTGKDLDKECFMYAVRKDRRKFTRVYGLLKTNEELKKLKTTEFVEEKTGT